MIAQETIEFARSWFQTGIKRIENNSVNLGLTYLDKAIAVFSQIGETRMLTLARHYKLLGLKLDMRFEEAESLFADVMAGYTQAGDAYGQALLLTHLAEAVSSQGRWERGFSTFNAAAAIAEDEGFGELLAFILGQKGYLCRLRDDHVHALRLFRSAEELAENDGHESDLVRYRLWRAEVLSQMGEGSESAVLLEDVQNRLIQAHQFREAVEPLTLLKRLYEESGMDEDKRRVTELIHFCGQQMIKSDTAPRARPYLGPPIA